jgi:hypothetical protein
MNGCSNSALGAIDLDQISSAEFAAFGCLFGVPPAHPGA